MRPEVLQFLACPNCQASLDLAAEAKPGPDGHIMTGALVCRLSGCRFSVEEGVPMLVSQGTALPSRETAARFDGQWKHWRRLHDYYERQLLEWIHPAGPDDIKGRVVLEGGCGKGRHSAIVAEMGARAVVAVDLGESTFVAFENTRHLPTVHVVRGDLLRPPVGPVFDLAFSVGVIHHLPDPAAGFRSLASRVREGGRVVVWVYGRENNEWIVRFVDPLRQALTSRLPQPSLRALSAAPAAAMWAAVLAYPALPAAVQKRLPYAEYFASLRDFPFEEVHNIVFDQLVPPIAHYLPGDEVRRWFATGFRDADVRWKGRYSWTGVGTVARAPTPN